MPRNALKIAAFSLLSLLPVAASATMPEIRPDQLLRLSPVVIPLNDRALQGDWSVVEWRDAQTGALVSLDAERPVIVGFTHSAVSMSAGCNGISGGARATNGQLTIAGNQLRSTLRACAADIMEREAHLLRSMPMQGFYHVIGQTLHVFDGTGVLQISLQRL